MTPAELKPIVETWGGPERFATILGVGPRVVYYWLEGKRNMSAPTAKLIRSLKSPQPRKEKP
jgi:DNA-binding transcriptional regulator YdaS (Cro superfamily)